MIDIDKREKRIDSLFDKIKKLQNLDEMDIELIAEFTKYLCILVSGHLEKSIYLFLSSYATTRSCKEISTFVDKNLKLFTNAKLGKIESLLESFKKEWKDKLINMHNYDEIKASINSLITDRHAIAHGNTLSLSMSRLNKYYLDTKKLLNEIESLTPHS